MRAVEIVSEQLPKPKPAPTSSQIRVQQAQKALDVAKQQDKRQKAQRKLQKAQQAVVAANTVTEAVSGTHDFSALVNIEGIVCRTTINADGFAQAKLIAEHIFGKANVRSIL